MSFQEKFASIQLQKMQLLVLGGPHSALLSLSPLYVFGSEPDLKKETTSCQDRDNRFGCFFGRKLLPGRSPRRYESNLASRFRQK
jgi:hypothetical protein